MLKPPAPTIPGMTDTLDFVKNLWGSMHIPGTTGMPGMSGLASPTLSTEELDKRIADLKAVEAWLNMNISMLRGTIQALEVQRGTLAALKSMGSSMAEAMRQSGVGADKMAANPFASFFAPPSAPAAGKPASPSPASASAAPAGGGSAQPGAGAPGGSDAGAGAAAATGMPPAMAWWNMLQDQFTQAVNSAMSAPAPGASGGAAGSAGPAGSASQAAPAASPATPPAPDRKTASPAPNDPAAPADADAGAPGNGKARTPRARNDKA